YSTLLELDLAGIRPSLSGPKRPQDRIELPNIKTKFESLFETPVAENGFGKLAEDLEDRFRVRRVNGLVQIDASATGGGLQDPQSQPDTLKNNVSPANTNPLTETEMMNNRPTPDRVEEIPHDEYPEDQGTLGHGDVVIAAITSCTNTSNPSVMLAAGLLAKKAAEKGMVVNPSVKASLAPGSRVVTDYLERTGLQEHLNKLGFNLVGYG